MVPTSGLHKKNGDIDTYIDIAGFGPLSSPKGKGLFFLQFFHDDNHTFFQQVNCMIGMINFII